MATRVLVVHEDPVSRACLQRALPEARAVGSVAEALRAAAADPPTVVVVGPLKGLEGFLSELDARRPGVSVVFAGPAREAPPEAVVGTCEIDADTERVRATVDHAHRLHLARVSAAERGRVLLVEDDPTDVFLSRRALRRIGWSVTHVDCLCEALQRLEEESFGLIVSDLGLPDAQGIDAVAGLVRAAPELPLVVLSGNDDPAVGCHTVDMGAQDHLPKQDLDPGRLERAIHHAIARKRAEVRLVGLARTDPLTGLLNRRAFEDEVRAELHALGGALLVLDLDDFKIVNDTLGHDAGDALLVAVADALGAVLRATDRIGRIGGDEFAVFLPGVAQAEAEHVASRLVAAASGAWRSACGMRATTSVGIALADGPGALDVLMKQADLAMYAAKRAGRDGYAVYAVPERLVALA